VLASGPCPDQEVYTIRARPARAGPVVLRLETLPDASLPHGGSGRYPGNGNFHLTGIRVERQQGEARVPVEFARGFCDFEAGSSSGSFVFVAGKTIGYRGKALPALLSKRFADHWDPSPRHREPHALVLEADRPFGPAGAELVITLEFRPSSYKQHILGRFRLAVSSDPLAGLAEWLRGPGVNGPASIVPRTRLALAYLLAGKPDRASALLGASRAGTIERALRVLALARQGKGDEARELARHLLAGGAAEHERGPVVPIFWLSRLALHEAGVSEEEAARRVGRVPRLARLWQLNAAVSQAPDQPGLLLLRGDVLASEGRWLEAAQDHVRARGLGADSSAWMRGAALLLKAGAVDEYRRHARLMREQFGASRTPETVDKTVKASLLLPDPVDAGLVERIERVAGEPGHPLRGNFQLCAALANVRAGRWLRAMYWSRLARASLPAAGNRPELVTLLLVIDAMALERLGRAGEARRSLTQAARGIDLWRRDGAFDYDWLIAELLHAEAARQLDQGQDR
jgi:hypothetical protein